MASGVTPLQIYQSLLNHGASTLQAIGIMANMMNESSLNPEAQAIDSNGLPSSGLVQENGTQYTGLVTGNPVADMNSQIALIAQNGGFAAASGPTPQAAAQNFAANYEKCTECQPGGQQYSSRGANAAVVSGWVTSGNWPTSAGSASVTGSVTSAQSDCLIGEGGVLGVGSFCLLSKSEARAVIGGMLLTAGLGVGVLAVLILAIYGLRETGAGRVAVRGATGALEVTGLSRVVSGITPAARRGAAQDRQAEASKRFAAQQRAAVTGQRVERQYAAAVKSSSASQSPPKSSSRSSAPSRSPSTSSPKPPAAVTTHARPQRLSQARINRGNAGVQSLSRGS